MKTIKLPIGAKNVVIKKIKTAKAKGASIKKGWEGMQGPKQVEAFNRPVLCITLRKVA